MDSITRADGATRTTLADESGTVHAVTLPHIPAHYPNGGTVTVRAHCGAGRYSGIPAHLARQARHPAFVGRTVTCPDCLNADANRATLGPSPALVQES